MLIRFDHRVVVVTGAAQGIGRATAEAFREAGAIVHLADRDGAGLKASADALGLPGHVADLADRSDAGRLVGRVLAEEGRLDILALAAGGVRGQVGGPLEEVTEEGWRALFAANVDSAVWLAQAAAPAMRANGGGRIVAVASGAGLRPSMTGIQAYAAAKHALVGLVKQLSWELAPHGITVNAVAPGFVRSNPATERQWEAYGPEGQAQIMAGIHTRRLGRPEDIANAILFLASDAASWISGQILSVDGGRS